MARWRAATCGWGSKIRLLMILLLVLPLVLLLVLLAKLLAKLLPAKLLPERLLVLFLRRGSRSAAVDSRHDVPSASGTVETRIPCRNRRWLHSPLSILLKGNRIVPWRRSGSIRRRRSGSVGCRRRVLALLA
jgi:hypothetical protein